MMKNLLLIFLFFSFCFSQAQTITGTIYDAVTKEPISGVNVYYAGTSKGTITSLDGTFEIDFYDHSQSVLVLRILGYESQQFTNVLEKDFNAVYLKPQIGELDAVYINPDPWSRKKKERYFISQFLGTLPVAKKCKILNLDKIRMRFNPSTNKMTAYAQEPVLIENKDLSYLVSYDLKEFEIAFEDISLLNIQMDGGLEPPTHRMVSSLFVGSAYFKELDAKDAGKRWVRRHRKRAYKVAEVRLFKLIAEGKFEEEGYHLVFKRKTVAFKDHVRSRKKGNLYEVDFRENTYEILDSKGFQSAIYLDPNKLYISPSGNVANYHALKTGGFISELKISGMLPLDYLLE